MECYRENSISEHTWNLEEDGLQQKSTLGSTGVSQGVWGYSGHRVTDSGKLKIGKKSQQKYSSQPCLAPTTMPQSKSLRSHYYLNIKGRSSPVYASFYTKLCLLIIGWLDNYINEQCIYINALYLDTQCNLIPLDTDSKLKEIQPYNPPQFKCIQTSHVALSLLFIISIVWETPENPS